MKRFLTILFSILFLNGFSNQDTIKVMQYNLLHFGNFTSFCNLSNNNPENKRVWLKTMFDYYLPDILSVNEISANQFYHNMILNQVLNASGRNYYAKAAATNLAGSDIINMLYYNTQKVGLASQDVAVHPLRDINVYKLYHNSGNYLLTGDTTFFYIFSAHFKSGTNTSDILRRTEMAQAVINYIVENQITEACMMIGDLNLQGSSEPAWQVLTGSTPEFEGFSDPANKPGNWNKNPEFVMVHTQSTRTIADGCGAVGGMDDRFDFILVNDPLLSSEANLKYIQQSYRVPGQDGQRFDGSLIDPPNFSAPIEVIEAMYNLSDHLPVMVDLLATTPQVSVPESWNFTQTINSHIIILTQAMQPLLHGQPIASGDAIGVFYVENSIEKCAGYSWWNNSGSTALVAYGDDFLTPGKEGFEEDEPFIFKLFSAIDNSAFYADVSWNENMPDFGGNFTTNGLSALTRFDAQYLQLFTIDVPQGWSGVSSFIKPNKKSIKDIFSNDFSKIDFLFDGENIFYPGGELEEIKYWEEKKGYSIKSKSPISITFEGLPIHDATIDFAEGWNLLPVLVPCLVTIEDINAALLGKIEVVVAVAGVEVFWPAFNIQTLQTLVPGKSYLIKVSEDCSFTFDDCD